MKPFTRNPERDAAILRLVLMGLKPLQMGPLVMQLPEMEGGPDRLTEYGRWISSKRNKAYRKRIAEQV